MIKEKIHHLDLVLLLVLLAGCAGQSGLTPTVTPTLTATSTSAPTPSPSPTARATPVPTEESTEQLWGFPIDDTHDAFEVDTNGKLGTVLVTVEIENEDAEEFQFSVWTQDDLNKPIQTMLAERCGNFHWHDVMDANFDGYMDFGYQYALGVQVGLWHLWLWDETQCQFVEEPEFANIPSPQIDEQTQIIEGWSRSSAAGDGVDTFHRWENGKLVCVRRITAFSPWGEATTLTVEERVNGKLQKVYDKEFPWEDVKDETEGMISWMQERTKWYDLNYHGE